MTSINRRQEAAENAERQEKEKSKASSGTEETRTEKEESISSQRDQKPSSTEVSGAMSPSPNAHVLELMEGVFNKGTPLNPAQQQLVISALQSDPNFMRECNFSPQKVSECRVDAVCAFSSVFPPLMGYGDNV